MKKGAEIYALWRKSVNDLSSQKDSSLLQWLNCLPLKPLNYVGYWHYAKQVKMYFIAKNIKGFKIAYVLYHFINRLRWAHNLSRQKNFETKIIKIVLTIYMSCKKNVMPCHLAWFIAKFPLTWAQSLTYQSWVSQNKYISPVITSLFS